MVRATAISVVTNLVVIVARHELRERVHHGGSPGLVDLAKRRLVRWLEF